VTEDEPKLVVTGEGQEREVPMQEIRSVARALVNGMTGQTRRGAPKQRSAGAFRNVQPEEYGQR
jgi:hypothetical protein